MGNNSTRHKPPSSTNRSYPNLIDCTIDQSVLCSNSGKALLRKSFFKKGATYDRFAGGTFVYGWESIIDPSLTIELHSNMDLKNIEPPAVNIHAFSLDFMVDGKVVSSFSGDNYRYMLGGTNSEEKLDEIRHIVKAVGLMEFCVSEITAWDILMLYVDLPYLSYQSFTDNKLDISKIHDSYGLNKTMGSNNMYKCEFVSWKNKKINMGLIESYQSWTEAKDKYDLVIKFSNHCLEYRTSKIKVLKTPKIRSQLIFDGLVFYQALSPEQYGFQSLYSPGIFFEIDKRSPHHPSIAFAFSLLKFLQYPETEQYWRQFVGKHGFGMFRLLFDFFRPVDNSFMKQSLASLAKQQKEAFTDLLIIIG